MNATVVAVAQRLESMLGGFSLATFGAVDLFHFGKLASTTDLTFVLLGLSIVTGVNLVKTIAGAAAADVTPVK